MTRTLGMSAKIENDKKRYDQKAAMCKVLHMGLPMWGRRTAHRFCILCYLTLGLPLQLKRIRSMVFNSWIILLTWQRSTCRFEDGKPGQQTTHKLEWCMHSQSAVPESKGSNSFHFCVGNCWHFFSGHLLLRLFTVFSCTRFTSAFTYARARCLWNSRESEEGNMQLVTLFSSQSQFQLFIFIFFRDSFLVNNRLPADLRCWTSV